MSAFKSQPLISNFLHDRADFRELLYQPDGELVGMMVSPLSRFEDLKWEWPSEWYPHRSAASRTVNFSRLSGSRFEILLKRYILCAVAEPTRFQRDIASVHRRSTVALRLFDACRRAGFETLSSIPIDVAKRIIEELGSDWRASSWFPLIGLLEDLERYAKGGLLRDHLSSLEGRVWRPYALSADPSLDAPTRRETRQEDADGIWQPLPDAWLNSAATIWFSYLRDLGPSLVKVADAWGEVLTNTPAQPIRRASSLSADRLKYIRGRALTKLLQVFHWPERARVAFGALGVLPAGRSAPKTRGDLTKLLVFHQSSLFQLLLLLTAARRSEITSLKPSADLVEIVNAETGQARIRGRSYKYSGASVGEEVTWPLPIEVTSFVENQISIAAALMEDPSRSLWFALGQGGSFGKPLVDHRQALRSFCQFHKLDEIANGSVHPHRFRKTMARLAVLSLQGAPLVLQQILGHQNLTPTLKYIYSDPGIRDDLRDLLNDHRLDLAEGIAENLDNSGGPAANTLRSSRDRYFDVMKVPKEERSQRRRAREFAAARLAEGGVDLKVLSPGVICVKPLQMPGRCAAKGQEPNLARCEVTCPHYLALPERREHTQDVLDWLLQELSDPAIAASELLAPWYRAQFVEHMSIFPDVETRYRSDPRVEELVGAR